MKRSALLLSAIVLSVAPLGLAAVRLDVSAPQPGQIFDGLALKRRMAEARKRVPEGGRLEVVFAPGVYTVTKPVVLDETDGHTVWKAAKPGTVRFRGGCAVPASLFRPARQNGVDVRVADVSSLLPEALPPWPRDFRVPPSPWLYRDSRPMVIARWPNDGGWMTFTNAVVSADEMAQMGQTARKDSIVCEDPAGRKWDFAAGVWFYGYWCHDWSESFVQGASYDAETKQLRFSGRHSYGFGGRSWGFKQRRFFALNALSELDAPGEWFLDRANKRLYVVPQKGEEKAQYVLATLNRPFVRAKGLVDFVFENLVFECAHADTAVVLEASERVAVVGSTFVNLGGAAIDLSGRDSVIRGSRFANLGKTAVRIEGGDRRTLEPGNVKVVDCTFLRWAQFMRTYNPGVYVAGCGQVVRGCRFREAPHNAILYAGNNHLFESNEFDRVLLETADAGAIYTGRNPSQMGTVVRGNWFHDLGGPARPEHTIAVYFDDCDWGESVISNKFERCGRGILIGGGNLFRVEGNTFSDCTIAIHLDSRGKKWPRWRDDLAWFDRIFAPFMPFNDAWRKAYPDLERTLKVEPQAPWNNAFVGNRFADCGQVFRFDAGVNAVTNRMTLVDNLVVEKP